MSKNQPVSLNLISDIKMSDDHLKTLYDSIKFTFKTYSPKTNYKLPNSIKMVSPIKLSPLGIANSLKLYNVKKPIKYKNFFIQYFFFKYVFSDFLEHDINIMITKYSIDNDLGNNNIFVDSKSAKFLIILSITNCLNDKFDIFETVQHELLHCHPMFNFNTFFEGNHCHDEYCVMHKEKIYKLNEPYYLCDSCIEKIKKFNIPEEVLKKNIKKDFFNISDKEIDSVLKLIYKINSR